MRLKNCDGRNCAIKRTKRKKTNHFSCYLGVSNTMVCMRVAFHENDRNHENDEDDSDRYRQGVECWMGGNHGNHGNDENHGNPGGANHGLPWPRNKTCENRTCENWPSSLSCTFSWALEIVPWALEIFPWALSWEFSWGPSGVLHTEKVSTFVGIFVDIFVYTLVGIFVSTFVREFVGQISRFACSVLFWYPNHGFRNTR